MSVPSAPVIVVAPLASPNTLEFAWERPVSDGGSPITGYRFQLDSETPVNLNANTFYYMVTGLTNSQTYYATIEAQNANGFSSKASFRPFEPGSPPNPPATATAVTSGTSNAVVSWTPPTVSPDSTIFWYVINSISNNSSDPTLKITANGLTQSNYLINNLNRNSSYAFDVQAVNCPGYSSATRTNTIQWFSGGEAKLATRSGGATTQIYSTVAVDTNGNVYQLLPLSNTNTITIYNYSGAPTGGGAVQTSVYGTISATGQGNIILIKYNSDGAVQWATRLDRYQSGDLPASIATDTAGNVYVSYANYNQSTVTLYNYSSAPVGGGAVGLSTYGTLSSPSGLIMVLVKYNSSGSAQWATKVATNGLGMRFPAMNVDPNGNVYFAAFTSDTTTTVSSYASAPVGGGAIGVSTYGTYTKIGTYDLVLVKYNTSGVAQWATALSNIDTATIDLVCQVAGNSAGDIYISSSSNSSTVTIRSFTSVGGGGGAISTASWGTIATNSGSGRGAVLVKYNSAGTPVWATRMVPVASVVVRTIPYMSMDASGNVYWVAGIVFAGTLTLYSYTSGGGSGGLSAGLSWYPAERDHACAPLDE
jgi:hypothetical protein